MARTRLEFFDTLYFGSVLAGAEEWAISRGAGGTRFAEDANFIKETLLGDNPSVVLDYGCGRGELMAFLAQLGHGKIRCVGVDPAPVSALYRTITFKEFEVEEWCKSADSDFVVADKPFGRVGYDVVVARNVFECLDPDAIPRSPWAAVRGACEKMRGYLRPGGRIVLRTDWQSGEWNEEHYEEAVHRWRAAGAARGLVPWVEIDHDGRLALASKNDPKWWERDFFYETLTAANPWPGTPEVLANRFFEGMVWAYDEESNWLVLGEK